jgi:hypothetical protein
VKGLSETFADSTISSKFENMDPNTERFLLIDRNVHSALYTYKQNYHENINKPSKSPRAYSLKE